MGKLRLKRTVGLLIIVVLILAGCSNGNKFDGGKDKEGMNTGQGNSGQPVDITIYGSWSTEQEKGRTLKNLIGEYTALSNGKVKVNMDINSEWSMYLEKVKTMIAADKTPDLFTFNFNPNDLSRQQSGKLMDFMPYMDDEWKSSFRSDELEAMVVDGQLNTIPFERSGLLFYYNKDLFAKANVERFPQTWDEFFEACDKLQAIGVAPISLMTTGDAWHTANLFSYLTGSAGGAGVTEVGKSLNTPEMVKAVENLKRLFTYTTTDALGADYSVSANHFLLGDTAMIVDGPWMSANFDKTMQGSIGVAGGPTFGDDKIKPGFIVTDAYTPWAAGKPESMEKERAIVDLMKFLTSPESSKRFFLEGSVSLSTSFELTDEEKSSINPVLATFMEVTNESPESVVQISRMIKPTASSEFSSLLEGLLLDQFTPLQFVEKLDKANQ